MNNSDSISMVPQEGGSEESASSSSTFSGIPGLGRLGNASKSESSKPCAGSEAAENHVEELAVSQEKLLETTDGQAQEDSTMADAESFLQESATSTTHGATSEIPSQIKYEALQVMGIDSEQLEKPIDSEMRQLSQEDAEVSTHDTNSNAVDAENLKPTTKLHVEKIVEVPSDEFLGSQPSTNDIQVPKSQSDPPNLTHALEAMLGGLMQPVAVVADVSTTEDAPAAQTTESEHPEWEIDSSPYESSSDSSSDSSSEEDSEDEDGENTYKLLSPEEQARILMEGDGGSDDEGASKGAKGAGAQLRTKNEVPEEIIPKPDVTITREMPITKLGDVEGVVDNIVLIKAFTTGEYQVLREESVLCLEDRSVIGVVSETLGRVEQPLYCVRFTNAAAITEAGLSVGTTVFYSEQHSTYVFTQALKAYKGTDASNLYDEEVGDEEMEFSDDEKEAEHKRRIKQKKAEKRGVKTQQNGGHSHGGQASQQSYAAGNGAVLNYDEAEDGPYKTLTRPSGFTGGASGGEALQEGSQYNRANQRSDHVGRGRGRGRGDRGRGDRGRGRGRGGGNNDRSNSHPRGGSSQANNAFPPPNPSPRLFNSQPASLPQKPNFLAPLPSLDIYGSSSSTQPQQYHNQKPQQYPSLQPPVWPMYPPGYQQPYQQPQPSFLPAQNNWPGMPPPPTIPAGAFINPAFFAQQNGSNQNGVNQWTNPGQQNGNGGSR
ncbi:37088e2c-fa00-417a-b68e-661180182f7b-CDS [Sclerotinia trifoliorum]|uniref:H/ACA ribonucleoprotein complex non-core subunit NAF1 n=1 Tax=Sclerotinia trifoliorum TaxID=28548 RepID=A0A8H2ZS17_9HELO|nr:37088e2c-fa00-417a-b68e-661180182f7b-CDS [Sclerotinia trifoliorum]